MALRARLLGQGDRSVVVGGAKRVVGCGEVRAVGWGNEGKGKVSSG